MPLVPWSGLADLHRRIADGRVRLIGWGAGGSFRAAYAACPLRLAYLVDSNPDAWGRTVYGVPVRPPSALAAEDPDGVAVVIYPAFLFAGEILRAIDALGPYRAIFPYQPAVAARFVRALREGIRPDLVRKPPGRSRRAILLQGPVVPEVTETALRFYASRYPNDMIVLSTWDDTPAPELERLAPLADAVVTSPVPAVPGPQNRNLQGVSTLAGLERLAALGVETVLKTRTDTLAAASDLLARGEALLAAHPLGRQGRAMGLGRRLAICERFTFRYLPYTMSDIVMFGGLEDQRAYWAAPPDPRRFSPYTPEWRSKSYRAFAQAAGTPEIHFLTSFCRRAGRSLAYTVEDHWTLLRDLFVLVDEDWFGLFFPKYGFDDIRACYGSGCTPAAVAGYALWERLQAGVDLSAEAAAIDIDRTTFEAMIIGPPPDEP